MEQLYTKGQTFMTEMLEIANAISAKISTITIALKTNSMFNLEKVINNFHKNDIQNFIYDITGDKHSINLSNKKTFCNSIIFKCCNIPTNKEGHILDKQAVKVFCNGSVHITGVKDIYDALYLGEVFITMLELIYGGTGVQSMFQITDYEIQLMNFYFKLPGMLEGMTLKLVDVLSYLKTNTNYAVTYNNERHAGVILRSPTYSVLIFDTGNVIICSITEPSHLQEAVDFVKDKLFKVTEHYLINKEVLNLKRICRKKTIDFDYTQYLVLK